MMENEQNSMRDRERRKRKEGGGGQCTENRDNDSIIIYQVSHSKITNVK